MEEPKRTDSSVELAAMVAQDPNLQARIKQDPAGTLQSLARPLDTDRWVYRIVVLALGLTAILVVIGAIVLTALNKNNIPDALVAIGSASIAALAALLAPSPRE